MNVNRVMAGRVCLWSKTGVHVRRSVVPGGRKTLRNGKKRRLIKRGINAKRR